MRTALNLLMVSFTVLLVSGCSQATGTWRLANMEPRQAEQQFNVQSLRLASDGEYDMDVIRNGRPQHMSGKYSYSSGKETITFRDDSGVVQTYNARVDGDRMRLWSNRPGEQFEATLSRTSDTAETGTYHSREPARPAGTHERERPEHPGDRGHE
ncbi:MAG: hypothetical protein AB1716_02715 [Planctomycetota bacterium]